MKYLYHGSNISGLIKILPFKGDKNAFKEKVSCYSFSFNIALLYIRKYPFHWVSFDFNDDLNTVTYTEEFPNMLEKMYQGISGSIYYVNQDNPSITLSRFKNMFVAKEPIIPIKELYINDVYDEIINQEKQGRIIIRRYDTISKEERSKKEEIIYFAIVKERLVIDPWKKSLWVKKHFSRIWNKAVEEYSKRTHEEILNDLFH